MGVPHGGERPMADANTRRAIASLVIMMVFVVGTFLLSEGIDATEPTVHRMEEDVKLTANARANRVGMISSVQPDHGPFRGGNLVTITGKSLTTGQPGDLSLITLNGHRVAQILSQSPKRVVVKASRLHSGSHQPGMGALVVVSRTLGMIHLNAAYTYHAPPHPLKVTGGAGPRQGGNTVVIHGKNLCARAHKGHFDTKITLASVPAKVTRCTRKAVYVTAGPLKSASTRSLQGDVHISSKKYGMARMPRAYEYRAAPQITNVTPRHGPAGGGNIIRLSGSTLTAGRGAPGETVQVLFGGHQAQVVAYTPSSVDVEAPAKTGARCVRVEVVSAAHGHGSAGARLYCYHSAPTITGVEPAIGRADGGIHATIKGKYLHTGDVTSVWFGRHRATVLAAPQNGRYVTVRTPRFDADEEGRTVLITVNSHSRGKAKLLASAGAAFRVAPRGHVARVFPNRGPLTGQTHVTITGQRLTTGEEGDLREGMHGIKARLVHVSPSKVVVVTGRARRASRHSKPIILRSAALGVIKSPRLAMAQFKYTALPQIQRLIPTSGKFKGGHTLDIRGVGFCDQSCKDLVSVRIGTVAIKDFVVHSPRRIVVKVPHGDVMGGAGLKSVSVVSRHRGTAVLPAGYNVEAAEARASVTPSNIPMRGGTRVTLTTRTATHGAAEYRVWLAGVPAEVLDVKPNQITVLAGDATTSAPEHPHVGSAMPVEGEVVLEEKTPKGDGYVILRRSTGARFLYNPSCEITQVMVLNDPGGGDSAVKLSGHHLGFGDEVVTLNGAVAYTRLRKRRRHDVVELEVEPTHRIKGAPRVVVTSPRVGSCAWAPELVTKTKVLQQKGQVAWNEGVGNEVLMGVDGSPANMATPKTRLKIVNRVSSWKSRRHYASPTTSFVEPQPTYKQGAQHMAKASHKSAEVLLQEEHLQDPPSTPASNMASKAVQAVMALPTGYETGLVEEGVKLMSNRRCYTMRRVPEEYHGMVHVRGPNFTTGKPLNFVVARTADVYIAVDSRHQNPILTPGFKATGKTVMLAGCHRPTLMQVYVSRRNEAGLVKLRTKPGYMLSMWVDPHFRG